MDTCKYVLIVDDDLDTRTILAMIVARVGVMSREAADGREALNLIGQQAPTLVLLDLMMPVMNGFEVLSFLQGDPHLRRIPVIVVSAVTDDTLLMLPGVQRVIRKASLRISELQQILSSSLNGSHTSAVR